VNPIAIMSSSLGEISIQLFPVKAPATVANFLGYVESGFYDGTIFHRVIPDFMIQGGGYTPQLRLKKPGAPIPNEAPNGNRNVRGGVTMARTTALDSANCQFFINLVDNRWLDQDRWCVFGQVVEGMEVVDAIAGVEVAEQGGHRDVPMQPVTIDRLRLAARVEPAWLAWNDGTVAKLARGIDADRRFEDLPILADALEEAGCTDPMVLTHCRSGRRHDQACWVVLLLLGGR
jgi:peptidyl-prolyl cis-trans isomerase A (cyclophilin A)